MRAIAATSVLERHTGIQAPMHQLNRRHESVCRCREGPVLWQPSAAGPEQCTSHTAASMSSWGGPDPLDVQKESFSAPAALGRGPWRPCWRSPPGSGGTAPHLWHHSATLGREQLFPSTQTHAVCLALSHTASSSLCWRCGFDGWAVWWVRNWLVIALRVVVSGSMSMWRWVTNGVGTKTISCLCSFADDTKQCAAV